MPTSLLTHPAELDSALDFEIPPIARCTTCWALDCDGCRRNASNSTIAWERPGSWLGRLWVTAQQSVQAGERSCLDGDRPRPLAALSFAIVAELLTGASVAIAASLVSWALGLPFGQLDFFVWVGLGLAGFLVAVHALWGFGLELALSLLGVGFSPKRGLSFALYACGWDLVTSPVGILAAIAISGPSSGWAVVRQAARVPRAALLRYLTESRAASETEATWAVRFSFLLPVGLMIAVVVALLIAWVRATLGAL